jgi:hypothetical protein
LSRLTEIFLLVSAARYGPPAKASADVVAALLMTRLCISLILGIEYLARVLHLSAIATVLPTVRLNLMWSEQLLCRNFRMMAGAFGLPLRQSQPQWRERPGRAQTYPPACGGSTGQRCDQHHAFGTIFDKKTGNRFKQRPYAASTQLKWRRAEARERRLLAGERSGDEVVATRRGPFSEFA